VLTGRIISAPAEIEWIFTVLMQGGTF